MAATAPFVWGSAGERLTPDQVERKRKLAEALGKQGMDYSPVQHWTQGAARVAQALLGGWEEKRAGDAEKANTAEDAAIATSLLGGIAGGGLPVAAAPVAASDAAPAASVAPVAAPADLLPRFAQAEAQYGLPRNFLAQTAKIESGFNPSAANPNSSARGLFQFVKGTARDYGLANPMDPIASTDAAARLAADNKATLMRALGREPTAGELYLAHQQGGGGASKLLANPDARAVDIVGADAVRLNGGNANMTAGEFARRWTSKLATNEADLPAPGAMPVSAETGQPGFAIPGDDPAKLRADAEYYAQTNPEAARQMLARAGASAAPAASAPSPAPAMTGQTFNAIHEGRPLDPVFQTEGVSQPWMGSALLPQSQPAPQMALAPMPPPRPADLAMPQADMPAPGAVPAVGQMPAAATPEIDPNSPDAGVRAQIAANAQGTSASPFAGIAQALSGGQGQTATVAAPTASPAVQQVAAAVAQNPSDPLVRALTSPAASDGTKKIAMALLLKKIEGDNKSPIAVGKDQRLVDPRTGRIILERDRNASDVKRSLTPVYGTDAQGNTVLLQPGDDGSAVQTKLPAGVKISAGVDKIDAGTEWILTDKRTGQVVGRQAKDIAGAEGQKIEGKAAAEAKIDLPGAIAQGEQALKTIQQARHHPGRYQFGATGGGTSLPIIGDGIPGTKGRDFVGVVEQIKGKAFLEAYSSLKGGGAISEPEGAKATQAIARLDRAQTKEGFDAALDDLEQIITSGIERAKRKAGVTSAPTAPAANSGWNEVAPGVRIREKR